MRYLLGVLFVFASLLLAGAASADDWTASRLRGTVVAGEAGGAGPWTRLHRDDVVSDARVIHTGVGANVEFTRGNETVSMGPDTQAQIVDRTGRLYTTVIQQSGTVAISAEARQVQHFAVETPYLAAVVKGTEFTVTTDKTGSRVAVSRGLVAVTDQHNRRVTMVPAGRTIVVSASGSVAMSGTANRALTHPVVNGVVEDQDDGDTGAPAAGQPTFGDQLNALAGGDGLLDTTGGLVGSVGQTAGGVVENTVGSTGAAAGGLVSGVGGTLDGALGGLGVDTGGALGGVTGAVGGVVTHTTGSVGSLAGGTVSAVGSTVGDTAGAVGSTAGSVGSTVGGAVGAVGGAVGGVVGSVAGGGGLLHHLGL